MSTRVRPEDCCAPVVRVAPLADAEREALVALCRALADPIRLEIFRLIVGQTAPICVCDIVDRFDRQQPTISHHLKVLREAELVRASRRGVWAYYEADAVGLARLRALGTAVLPEPLAAVG